MVEKVARFLYHCTYLSCHLSPCDLLTSTSVAITKLACPFVLHEHITNYYIQHLEFISMWIFLLYLIQNIMGTPESTWFHLGQKKVLMFSLE